MGKGNNTVSSKKNGQLKFLVKKTTKNPNAETNTPFLAEKKPKQKRIQNLFIYEKRNI